MQYYFVLLCITLLAACDGSNDLSIPQKELDDCRNSGGYPEMIVTREKASYRCVPPSQ